MTNRLTGTEALTGIVKDACLVSFTGLPEHLEVIQLLTGTVVQDFAGRFKCGNVFCSSPVKFVEGDIIRTEYSVYQVQGRIEPVDLPWQAFALVRALYDPKEIRAQVALQGGAQ